MAVLLRPASLRHACPWSVRQLIPVKHALQKSCIAPVQNHIKACSGHCVSIRAFRAACGASTLAHASDQKEADMIFMASALEEGRQGAAAGEVPVGAVLVHDGNIVARSHNLVEQLKDPTAHAEMLVIRQAAAQGLGRWDLHKSTLYITLEPCAMCAGAILISRVGTVVYGARSTLLGADGTWMQLFPCQQDAQSPVTESAGQSMWQGKPHPMHPNVQVRRGILSEESGALMKAFFQRRRAENNSKAAETDIVM